MTTRARSPCVAARATLTTRGASRLLSAMLHAHALAVALVTTSRREDEDAMMAGVAGLFLVLAIAGLALGISFHRKKKGGLAVLFIVAAGLSFLSCTGLSALLFLAQFAWH